MRILGFFLLGSAAVLSAVTAGGCRRSRFPPRGDAAAVVVVAPRGDAAPVPKMAEQEPNDNPEQAQLLALNPDWPLLSLDGSLTVSPENKGKDVDVFKLPIPGEALEVAPAADGAALDPRTRARRLSVELAAEGSDLGVQLLDDAAKPVAGISVPAGETAGMPNLAVLPGHTYYVRVKAAKPKPAEAATSRYRLTVQLGEFEVADEREPNDSRETANPVAVVGTVECAGYHGWQHDQDFFRLALPDVKSALDVELSPVGGVGASLQVVDSAGARLGYGRGRRDEALALRNVTVQPPPTGVAPAAPFVYVVVRAEAGQNRSQRYVLRISIGSPREGVEVEPNDAADRATPVKDGSLSAFLPAGDVDFFRYQSDGPRQVTITVSFPARVRGKLAAWREGEDVPAAEAEAKKARQTLTLAPVITPGRPIIVRVSAAKNDGNASEAYTLNIASAPTSNLPSSAAPAPTAAPASGGR